MPARPAQRKAGKGGMSFLIIFGLVFAAVGSLALFTVIKGEGEGDIWVGYVVGTVFVLVGLGIAIGGIFGWKKAKAFEALAAQYPDQPWMTKKAWAEGRIKDSNVVGTIAITCFALFWNTISWSMAYGIFFKDKNADQTAKYFVLLFPIAGLFLAWAAIHGLLKWIKFGSSVFEMAEVPGVIGGPLGGIIRAKAHVRPREGVMLTLQSIYKKVTGSGKNQHTHEDTLWEHEQIVPQSSLQLSGVHSLIPVLFDIPYDCRPTEELSPSEEYYWKLKASAKLDGIDYAAEFVVPVFKTANSRPDDQREAEGYADEDVYALDATALKEAGIVLSETASGAELRFSGGRRPLYALFPMVFGGAMFCGAVATGIYTDIPKIFPIVFGIFGLFVEITSLGFLIGKVSLQVDASHLEYRKSGLAGAKQESIAAETITAITPYTTMTVNGMQFYGLQIERTGGKPLKIPANITGRMHADAICRILTRHLKG